MEFIGHFRRLTQVQRNTFIACFLSPLGVRGTLPGFAYQIGNLFSSRDSVIQAKVTESRYGGSFAPVLAWTVLLVASLVAVVTWSGRERRGVDLSNTN